MRFLRKKGFWYSLYAVAITGVFLYALFPAEPAARLMENAAQKSGWRLQVASVAPSLPWGVTLQEVSLAVFNAPGARDIQADRIRLQPRWWTAFSRLKQTAVQGRAYGGGFDGIVGFASLAVNRPPEEVRMRFEKIDLARLPLAAILPVRGASGFLSGNVAYNGVSGRGAYPDGEVSLHLTRGVYVLPEPFVGIDRLEFDRGELQARLQGGVVTLEKLELYGTTLNCFLTGQMTLAPDVSQSALNLKGVFELTGQNKMKMNVTLGGTLQNPIIRYI
ncbi:MAG TPA: type II secretion system protein GspN [Smithellaceae bacterium]|nr:type II secretion system protein GspN [Smithellaceae bacterium]